jgi:hypothetical protein
MAQPGTPGSTASRVAQAQGAGSTRNLGNGIFEQAGQYFAKVKDKFVPIGKDTAAQILTGGKGLMNQLGGVKGVTSLAGAGLTVVPQVATDLAYGRPLEAGVGTAGAVGSYALAKGLTKLIPGPVGKIAQVAVPAIAAGIGYSGLSNATSRAYSNLTGEPVPGKTQSLTAQETATKRAGNLSRSEGAKDYEQFTDQLLRYKKASLPIEMEAYQALTGAKNAMDAAKQLSLIAQAQNAANTRNYMAMGNLATASALAKGAQAGRYQLANTIVGSNPYVSAYSPSISFG